MNYNLPQYYSEIIPDYLVKFPFCWINMDKEKPKDKPALYIFTNWEGNEILYIGKSNRLKSRIRGHSIRRLIMAVSGNECGVYFNYLIQGHNLNELEKKMIRKLRPKYNVQFK